MKSDSEILHLLLDEMFYKDFKDAKLCASDSLYYYTRESAKDSFYNTWLVRKGFATE